jgi:hypothetical protein
MFPNIIKDEEFYLLGYNAVQSVERKPVFQRKISLLPTNYTALCSRR